ncbi:MAG: DUF3168 domain-containing protein [Pseudorhodoferax sp.]
MSVEDRLVAIIAPRCPVFFRRAPEGLGAPYATIQHLGGRSIRFLDNTAPDKRNTAVQVTVWAATAEHASALLHAIAADVTTAPGMQASRLAGPRTIPDDELHGLAQDLSIWAPR